MKKLKIKIWLLIPILLGIIVLSTSVYYLASFSTFGRKLFGINSVCSSKPEITFLLVGIDYRGGDYLYGLADVIRLGSVDFENQTVNLVTLPRDLLVEIPADRFKVPGPYKINQAYFFGTPGMQNYYGEGEGAGALNEVINYNFNVSGDHYLVFNFSVFVDFINAIGGVDVNLPEPVYGGSLGDFSSGEQSLTGEEALALARIRENYSDDFRVRNQSIIIKAVIQKMMQPAMVLQYPSLINQFKDSVLTDLPFNQLNNAILCFQGFDSDNLVMHQVPGDLLSRENVFLTSLNDYSFVYSWDNRLVEWIQNSLTN